MNSRHSEAMESPLLRDSIFKIGNVFSVEGRQVKIKVDKSKNTSNLLYRGNLIKNVSVGGYVKITKGFVSIIGKVEGEFINEDKYYRPEEYGNKKNKIERILRVALLGFMNNGTFERGIKELPLIDNECYLLTRDEFDQVHDFVKRDDVPICIGSLSLEKGQRINIGVNSLFTSHIGIFGNTGSGKSYTLAKIYRELFKKCKDLPSFKENATFFLLDFNGEYIDKDVIIEEKYKNRFELSTREVKDQFPISEEAINDHHFWTVVLDATEKTQTPFLRRAISNTFFSNHFNTEDSFKVIVKEMIVAITAQNDRVLEKGLVVNFLKEIRDCFQEKAGNVSFIIEDYQRNLQWHNVSNTYYYHGCRDIYANQGEIFIQEVIEQKINTLSFDVEKLSHLECIHLKIIFQFYDEVIRGYSNVEHLAPLVKRLDRRIVDLDKVICVTDPKMRMVQNLTIVSLKDVNIHMKKILPLLMCKQLYDRKKEVRDESKYLNIIIDEAHNILSYSSERESETWKDYRLETFEEIIKEGRKFGVFLTVSSQRPSDISSTIISQLHNFFLHRLINNRDIEAVEKSISYLDKVSFEYLPILPTGTCILAGLLAQVPVVIDIEEIEKREYEPRNKTMTFLKRDDLETFSFQDVEKIVKPYQKWGCFGDILFRKRLFSPKTGIKIFRSLWEDGAHCFENVPQLMESRDFPSPEGKKNILAMYDQRKHLKMFGVTFKMLKAIRKGIPDENAKLGDIVIFEGNHRMSVLALREKKGDSLPEESIELYLGEEFKPI